MHHVLFAMYSFNKSIWQCPVFWLRLSECREHCERSMYVGLYLSSSRGWRSGLRGPSHINASKISTQGRPIPSALTCIWTHITPPATQRFLVTLSWLQWHDASPSVKLLDDLTLFFFKRLSWRQLRMPKNLNLYIYPSIYHSFICISVYLFVSICGYLSSHTSMYTWDYIWIFVGRPTNLLP